MVKLDKRYYDLLCMNLQKEVEFDNIDEIEWEFEEYEKGMRLWENYPGTLKNLDICSMSDGGIRWYYPEIHPFHRFIVDFIRKEGIREVLDVGSGPGIISKYIFLDNPGIDIECLEGSEEHIRLMVENFEGSDLLPPNSKTEAKITRGNVLEIPLGDHSKEFVFTSTVMMHIPYYMAIRGLMEIYRVSRKYICHVESKHGNIVMGKQRSNKNRLNVDYRRFYESLGVRTLIYEEKPYPNAEHETVIYYVGIKD